MTRRSLVFGVSALGSASAAGLLSSCSWVTSEPVTPGPTPDETPVDVTARETPEPEETERPEQDAPSPTPTPERVEQVLRVAGDLASVGRSAFNPEIGCFQLPATTAGLLAVDADLEIVADWAMIWVPSDQDESWLFQLHQNDQGWVSGAPVTAHDFVATWRRLLDPERQDPDAWRLFDIQNAREVYSGELPLEELGVVATDDWTLQVTLERPRQSFPALVASRILTLATASADVGPGRCDSNGPYHLASEDDDVLTLVPNEGYWSARPARLERIEISTEGPARSLDQFRDGTVDVVRLSPTDLPRARNDVSLRDFLYQTVPTRLVCLVPQIDVPPFDDVNVRRALPLVIDRERLELIVEGRVIPARRLTVDGLFPMLDAASRNLDRSLDVDTALELIASSGYPDPAEWPELTLVIPQGDSYMERVARDLANQLEENLGVRVPVSLIGLDEFDQGVRERRFPLTWVEWTYRYADPACAYADLFASWLNPDRPTSWEDEDYDELIQIADTFDEPEERAETYSQCEALLQELGVYVPLVHPVDHVLVQPWVENVPRDARGRVFQSGPLYTRFASELTITERT